jgi:hypothetical protein
MRRLAVLAFVLALAVPGTAVGRKPCALQEGYRILKQTQAAVAAWRPNSEGAEPFSGLTYRACLKSVGRWRTLHRGTWDGHSGHNPAYVALAGRYAAVSIDTGDSDGYDITVEVVNLRTGHHRSPLFVTHDDLARSNLSYLAKLRVSRYATLAWVHITSDPTYPERSRWQLTVHNAHGTRVLQNGAAHTFHRIRFRGSRLEWLHHRQPFSADLGRR